MILWIELIAIFIGIPLLFYFRVLPNFPIPALIALSILATLYLWRAGRLGEFLAWPGLGSLAPIVLRAFAICVALGGLVALFAPGLLFEFPRRAPALWFAVVLLYPLLSVFPQEILFRAFLFERYGPILHGDFAKAAASAIAFGFAHIVFGNWISVVLSAAGGALFAITYLKTGSLLAACLEHAIFGDFIFTIGLGQYFFHGARR